MARKRIRAFDPRAFLESVHRGKALLQFHKGAVIFAQGDPCDAVFYLQTGSIKLSVFSKEGKEAVIAILGPGSFFGEGCLGGRTVHMATVTTLRPGCAIRFEKRTMMRLLREEPNFSLFFLSDVLSRKIRTEEDLVDQLFNSAEKRLARTLLLLAHCEDEGRQKTGVIQISQETLAEMIGTTRSRVNGFMNKFRKARFVEYNGGVHVHCSLLKAVLED
jgi:CRP/FNR family transcriptional regulator, cyclic AMP receptor protein